MIATLFRIVNRVHVRDDLVTTIGSLSGGSSNTLDGLVFLRYGLIRVQLLVVSVHLQYVLTDGDHELSLYTLRQVKRDVPLRHDLPIACIVALLYPAVVVHILEQKYAPVVDRRQIQECEERLLLDRVNHERDEVLSLVECRSLRMYDDLVEVRKDDLAAQLFKPVEQLEKVLLHQFVYETMQQGVVELRLRRGRDPALQVRDEDVCVGIRVREDVPHPEREEVSQLLEDRRACHVLIKVGVELACRRILLDFSVRLLIKLASSGRCLLELSQELRLHNSVHCEDCQVELDAVAAVEAFLAHFRVFQLLLEVRAEVFLLVAAEVRLCGV